MASTEEQAVAPEGASPAPPKDPKKAEKERIKEEKKKKLADKLAKKAALDAAGATTVSKKAAKKEEAVLPTYVEKTPPGEKKILGNIEDPHHSAYIPSVVESAWDAWWVKQGFFEPEFLPNGENKPAGSFVIPIPPPNVTGALHCGHALGTALQDLLIRWHRMRGFTTLYVPGCDHASISTQNIVEKMLWKKEKKTRHDLGREAFLKRALEWKDEYQGKINVVMRRLGGSLDWTREAYTMDPKMSEAVLQAFVRLHEDGLIYRENRLVNWSVKLNTTISNLEVETKELAGRTLLDVPGYGRKVEFGVLTYFKYAVEGTEEFIEVGTTRLETMLGDVAVAVHPDDARYKHLVGKKIKHPFVDREIIIVADKVADPEFGTGAVKITPAHDQNDFNVGVRHNLELINIMNDNGTMNHNSGKFEGQKRYDARYNVLEELTKLGLFTKKEANPMSIKLCEKSKDVVEPLMKPQWWVKMESLAKPALEVVRDGSIKIRPESAEKSYFRWLEGINDWCVSRQLWWGHQIPAWRAEFEGEKVEDVEDRWFVAMTEEAARAKAEKKYPGKTFTLVRDPDVLDTWFSSGLWPFATLGWPKETHDLEKLFPTNVLESGWDILFFWIARMIMLSLKLTGKIPFSEVYCHSLLRDAQGRKMSKSLGNVIDPVAIMEGITLDKLQEGLRLGNLDEKELEVASKGQKDMFPQGIPECGADALRFSLVNYTTGGGDINFDVKVMAAFRRFCNKIYQATKYVLGNLPADYVPPAKFVKTGKETLPEKWMIHRLNAASKAVHEALVEREFSRSSQIVYQYWYSELCDVFIENSKTIIQDGSPEEKASAIDTLYAALEGGLTMIHPFMPFLSEELWQRLPRREGDKTPSIVRAAYPRYDASFDDVDAAEKYDLLIAASKQLRSLWAEYGIKTDGKGFVFSTDAKELKLLQDEHSQIRTLAGRPVATLEVLSDISQLPPGCAVSPVTSTTTAYLSVQGHVDAKSLLAKTQASLVKADEAATRQQKLMASEGWSEKASAAVKDAEEEKLVTLEARKRSLESSIEQFKKMAI